MSASTPPNSSSDGGRGATGEDGAPGAEQGTGVDLKALVARLANAFSVDARSLAVVASVFGDVEERAPDLFVPAAGGLGRAFAAIRESDGRDIEPVHAALGEWALDAENEPLERMRRDCLRFQTAMTRGALRLYAQDAERLAESLLALQRFNVLQVGLIATLGAQSGGEGNVVRTLPTPEYAAFMEIFRNAIESHRQDGKQLGLLVIHVPRVEQVDGLLGLQRGEAFMLRVTRRMREGVLRKQDQLGRVSRDQLACLLPRIAGEGVAILAANKIREALEAPIPIGERSFSPDAVVGIAMYPDHGADQQTLVRNGKLAARAAGGMADRVAVYDPAHGESEELKMRREARLRYALEESGLDLVFEPQLDVQSGRIGGLDCHLRWTDKELGKLTEAQAVETAEESGVTRELTWWMFNNALRQGAELARAGLDVPVAVRVTASGLSQPDFPEFIGRALRTWGVPPARLTIGIHESAFSGDIQQATEIMKRLKAHGVRLGIDGFGTGSSSLSNLARLPLDEMRLAAAFVGDLRRTPANEKIVRALIRLAKDLGLRIAAEGVGDPETALALSAQGCDRIQGEYVSEPLDAQEILAFESSGAGLSKISLRP